MPVGFNPLSWLTSGVIEGAGKVATDVGKTFWGDASARDAQMSAEQLATLQQYAAEFAARAQRTWWDSFVDGLNRLVRPGLALGAQASFVWAAWDPVTFSETMQALSLAPEGMWFLWAGIWAFYFGGRIIEKAPGKWKVEPKALEVAKEIAAERTSRRKAEGAEREASAAERKAAAECPPDPSPASSGQAPSPLPPEIAQNIPEIISENIPPSVVTDNGTVAERAVAATIWGEARSEPVEGKIAVAAVIRNRVNNPGWWGDDWISVCLAKAQFSCWWDRQQPRCRKVDERDRLFAECLAIARDIIAGNYDDPTHGADHYYADTIPPPKWAQGHEPTAVIGHHRFFKLGLDGRG